MTTTVVIGKQAEAQQQRSGGAGAGTRSSTDKFWPVDIAYFDETQEGGEDTPEYRISFKLHKNGLTRDLLMDYGDFS